MRTRLLLVLLLTACAGPNRPVDLGFKQVPSDVILGGAAPTATPTFAPTPVVVVPPPSVISLPPAPFDPGPTVVPSLAPVPSPTGCPTLDPLKAPALEAVSTPTTRVVPATYTYANEGTFAVSGADPRTGHFPALTQRTFANVTEQSGGAYTYDVAETIGDVTTTTTYRVVTGASLPGTSDGLFLVGMTYARAGTTATFTPNPSPLLAAFPLVRAATSDQRAVDPVTQTTMTFTTTVEGKKRVAACGEPLDTWTVHLSKGTLLSPSENLQFDATYQLATQFGAIVIADAVAYTGTEGSDGVQRSNRATITSPPRQR